MRPIERQILRFFGVVIALSVGGFFFWNLSHWSDAAQIAPVITAATAAVAALIAVYSISVQRDIARRRAAIDFFLKTELDATALNYFKVFKSFKRPQYTEWAADPNFAARPNYDEVRAFLNICELIAVGIQEKAFSDRVSYAYWGDVLPQALAAAMPLIERIRQTPGEGTLDTYCDLQHLCRRWSVAPPL